MPVLINLTSAEHGGKLAACGTHENCGVNCDCGCPYTGMEEKGLVEPIAEVETDPHIVEEDEVAGHAELYPPHPAQHAPRVRNDHTQQIGRAHV